MNKNHKARRVLAHQSAKKGQPTSKFTFGSFSQEITVGKCARKSKRPKVAGKNFRAETQADAEVVATY